MDSPEPAQHEQEVRTRWGDDAWETSARRRAGMSESELTADQKDTDAVNTALIEAASAEEEPESERFQRLIGQHHAWIARQWGGRAPNREAYLGLGALYTSDPRFASYYGGQANAERIQQAMRIWADQNL